MLKSLLDALNKELSIKILEQNNDTYTLIINDTTKVQAKEQKEYITLSSNIIEYRDNLELLTLLMKANLLGKATANAALGLTNDEKYLTLSTLMPYEVSYKELKEILEEFVNLVIIWRENIDKLIKQK